MALWGLFGRQEKAVSASPVPTGRGSGWFTVLEANSGNWQRNVEVDYDGVRAFHAVYACMTLIASDIAKLRVKLVQQDNSGVWSEIDSPAYSPVLRRPNHFQNRIQFWEHYMLSKLSTGNVYVLKRRDNRAVVTALHVLDPRRVTPLVTDTGDVYYQLAADNLAGQEGDVVVPASEIIHDRMNTIYHPLVGTSPIHAAGLAAMQGIRIQTNSTNFFANGARPSGILTAPGAISDETAQRLKEHWESRYTGDNAGKVAVLGDGLKYEPMTMTASDAQMIEQLKWTASVICSVFHVPLYKVAMGEGQPNYNNVQNLNVEYYSQCLQQHIEAAELCLDEGLGLDAYVGDRIGTEFDLDGLLRMDSKTQMETLAEAKNLMTLNERRRRIDLPKMAGGDTVYLQEQDHSLDAIAARDRALIEGPPPALPTLPPPDEGDKGVPLALAIRALTHKRTAPDARQ
ncbi:phage portal protein [Paracoccus suum]|uniref:Phage portal protein n=1 Tax=Paracoccus suum TaxID=2259340 RepID=A0A344PL02_9RHOB|nr:phage portal protein [Paracoccus suum]AXC50057.1 phage portal protein [Paracoccus suum]